ncbi:MAG TPA: hypothetical protein VMD03_06275 [Steroidobacteraceae bacterium]|nr:hypothetical protein [Steroidobacteraceae bacterium]
MPLKRRTAHKGIAWLVSASVLAVPVALRADEPPAGKPPQKQADDADLMEFLGGIGGEDEGLIKFLGRTDPKKVAAATVPKRPASSSADSSSSDSGSQEK